MFGNFEVIGKGSSLIYLFDLVEEVDFKDGLFDDDLELFEVVDLDLIELDTADGDFDLVWDPSDFNF